MSFGGTVAMNCYLSPNMLVRSSRRLVDTYIVCAVRVWFLIGLILLTLSGNYASGSSRNL